jgi:hypothetical protein
MTSAHCSNANTIDLIDLLALLGSFTISLIRLEVIKLDRDPYLAIKPDRIWETPFRV